MSVETANEELSKSEPYRGPWVVHFDDFRRKMLTKDIIVTKLMTASPGTDDYEAYINAYLDDANETIEICVEDDNKSTTFYTVKYPVAATATSTATIKE